MTKNEMMKPPRSYRRRSSLFESQELSTIIDTIQLPEHMIENVVVNQTAKDFLPLQSYWLIDSSSLIDRARIPYLRSYLNDTHWFQESQLIPKTHGRGIIEGYTQVTYGFEGQRRIGKVLIGKGGGISGKHYYRDTLEHTDIRPKITSPDPLGLFGKKEAEREMLISNGLLRFGAKAGLFCGYIEINPEALKEHLVIMFDHLISQCSHAHYTSLLYDKRALLSYVDIVTNDHRDTLVYTSRLVGCAERLETATRSYTNQEMERTLGFFRYGMNTVKQELFMNGSSWGRLKLSTAIPALEKMMTGIDITTYDIEKFRDVIETYLQEDLGRVCQAAESGFCGDYSLLSILNEYSQKKDIDFSLTHVDFEDVKVDSEPTTRLSLDSNLKIMMSAFIQIEQYLLSRNGQPRKT